MNISPGWWSDEEALALAGELLAESTFEARYPIWEEGPGEAPDHSRDQDRRRQLDQLPL